MASNKVMKRDASSDSDSSSAETSDSRTSEYNDIDCTGVNLTEIADPGIQPYQFEPRLSESDGDISDVEEDGANVTDRMRNTDWCSCGKCQVMTTGKECICCQEISVTKVKCEGVHCITEHPDFDPICLNRGVLDTAYYQYRQQYTIDDTDKRQDERYRHIAYRQLCRWCWRYLGKEVRRVLPSCAVMKIRETFTNPDEKYKGFQPY